LVLIEKTSNNTAGGETEKHFQNIYDALHPKSVRNIGSRHLSNQHIVSAASMPRLFMILVNIQRINYVIINHVDMIYCVDYCLIKLKTMSVGERTHRKVGLSQFKS
jgi:hypothetical protein